ncbi:MAG: hypothetical protein V1820_06285 [archaeon]
MPRAKIDFGEKWEATLTARLSSALPEKISSEPRTEKELFELALAEAGGKQTVSELKRLYSIQFSRALSNKSAVSALNRSVRHLLGPLLSKLPPEFKKSINKIQIGRGGKHGLIFFTDRAKAAEKLRKIYLSARQKSLGKEVLLALERRNFLPVESLPCPRSQAEHSLKPLFEFSLVGEEQVPGGKQVLFLPDRELALPEGPAERPGGKGGFLPLAEQEFPGGKFTRNFKFSRFSFERKEGIVERRLSFDLVVFQPVNGSLHLCDISPRDASVQAVRILREKSILLGVPAHLHLFATEFRKSAVDYSERNGILLHRMGKTEKD